MQNKFSRTLFWGVTPYFRLGGRSPLKIFASGGRLLTKFSPPLSLQNPSLLYFFPLSTTCLLSRPRPRIPMPFFEGESFLVQEAEDVEDWEEFFDFESYLGSE